MKFVLFVTLIWSILDSGWSITDEEYIQFKAGLAQIQVLTKEMQDLRNENHELRLLKNEVQTMKERMMQLEAKCQQDHEDMIALQHEGIIQNTTIEERVTILEAQMVFIQGEMVEIENYVAEQGDEIGFLFDEQVIQDERIFNLEERTLELDERVEVLEANGGGGGNVTALELRVETLEGTAAEHEADIEDLDSATSNLDGRVETLEAETSELETRLTVVETQIEDLQMADAELDARITDLEEGGGGGHETTLAFRAVMDETDDDIPVGSTVIFSDIQLNVGNGYDPATGVFTVPSGGDGYYYFATHFTVETLRYAYIDLRVNDVTVCSMFDDNRDVADPSNGGCNAVLFLEEGDAVWNVYRSGTDSLSIWEASSGVYNGFTGFRI